MKVRKVTEQTALKGHAVSLIIRDLQEGKHVRVPRRETCYPRILGMNPSMIVEKLAVFLQSVIDNLFTCGVPHHASGLTDWLPRLMHYKVLSCEQQPAFSYSPVGKQQTKRYTDEM